MTLFIHLFIDSFHWTIALMAAGALLSFSAIGKNSIVPIILTVLITAALAAVLPVRALGYQPSLIHLISLSALLISAYNLGKRKKSSSLMESIVDRAFIVWVAGSSIYMFFVGFDRPTANFWYAMNQTCLFVLLFYLIYLLAPWRFLSKHTRTNMATFLFVLALGFYVFRGAVWGYTLFQASVHSTYISFEMNGPVNSYHFAERWKFHRLQNWIADTQFDQRKTLHSETLFSEREIELLTKGVEEAEAFRQSLLVPNANGRPQAQQLAEAIAAFQQALDGQLDGRPNLDGFIFETSELVEAIRGSDQGIFGPMAFDGFEGKWYGEWDGKPVDHDWKATMEFKPSIALETVVPMCLRAVQYAWIGDGFGWNMVVSPNCYSTGDVILGTVYHVRDQNPEQIVLHRPHVGIELDRAQLIWITAGEIFMEEGFYRQDAYTTHRYAITGFDYEIVDGVLQNRGDAFQAVYTRDPNDRPPFIRIPLQLHIE